MDYKKASDRKLWQAVQQDDVGAYNQLFDRYAQSLYKRAACFIKDSMLAEELVMDVLFDLWQKRNSLPVPDDIPSYLNRSVRNRVLMEIRKSLPETQALDTLTKYEIADTKSADHELLVQDHERVYERLVSKLPPKQQVIFRMNREEDLSYTKISNKLRVSVKTVEKQMSSALTTLRKHAGVL